MWYKLSKSQTKFCEVKRVICERKEENEARHKPNS